MQAGFDGKLPADVASLRSEPAPVVGEVIRQHLAQVGDSSRFIKRSQSVDRLRCFQQCLLDHV